MYRTLVGILLSLLVALGLVGFTFTASVDAPAQFRFVNGTEPKTLDPGKATGEPERRLIEELFEGLTRRDPKSLRPAPGVALRWEISEDELTYTFHLRPDAQWNDGTPITAQDFIYSWLRMLDPQGGAEYGYLLYALRHGELYNKGAGYVAAFEEKLLPRLTQLTSAKPDGCPASELQGIFTETETAPLLQQSPAPQLAEFVALREGNVSGAQLKQLVAATQAELERLKTATAQARAHLGKDEGVYALDPHTLRVELRAPTPYFLEMTAFYPLMPVPRHVVERPNLALKWFLPETIVSNGPFSLTRWNVNDRIRLERSHAYWNRDQVRLERVDALPVENSATALNLYLTGAVDWLPSQYPTELAHELRKRPDFYVGPGMVVYFYRINCQRGALKDPRVRKALNLAFDRSVVTEQILGLGQLPAFGLVPPGMPGYTPPASEIRYDPTAARKLLAEAGYPDGKGIAELGILYNTHESHKQIAEFLADQFRRNLGIPANAYNQEWQSYLETTRKRNYDLARAGWIGDYQDPNTFLDTMVTDGGNNNTGFSSAAFDALIRAAGNPADALADPAPLLALAKERPRLSDAIAAWRSAGTPEGKRAAAAQLRLLLLREAEAVLVQDGFPVIPVYFYVHSGLISPRVRGFYNKLELPDGTQAENLQDIHPLQSIEVAP